MHSIERKYKIIAAVSNDRIRREELLCSLIVAAGMARTPGAAKQIISRSISDLSLETCFFVAVQNFNFCRSHLITQKLVRLALQGVPVFLSVRNIPNQILQFCEVYYAE